MFGKDKNKNEDEEKTFLTGEKLMALRQMLLGIKINVDKAIDMLSKGDDDEGVDSEALLDSLTRLQSMSAEVNEGGRVVEGVFDGENMIGSDGKQYGIPPNYASKSKLVEGDILKLTINGNGSFVYKQIGPVERNRLIGVLGKNDSGEFIAYIDNKKWKLITASVTYFKGGEGDEIVILVPKERPSKWAAVDNVIKAKD
jgi:hypothetical protein